MSDGKILNDLKRVVALLGDDLAGEDIISAGAVTYHEPEIHINNPDSQWFFGEPERHHDSTYDKVSTMIDNVVVFALRRREG